MSLRASGIPDFRPDGYLPDGLFFATEAAVTFRFGAQNRRRRRLALRIRRWISLARKLKAVRLLIDGSFVTTKAEPNDADAVVWLPTDFDAQLMDGFGAAIELDEMLASHSPAELFAAEDETDWNDWIEFFGRTRELDGRRKGLVEVEL